MKTCLIIFFSILLLTSCNNREEKERALKAIESRQGLLLNIKDNIKQLDDSLIYSIAELEVAKANLEKAKDFKIFRTESEREDDIRYATENIIYIERYINNLKNRIENLKLDQTFTTNQIDSLKSILTN